MDENESFIRSMIENKAFNISAIINLINKRGKKSLKNKILDDKLTKIIKYVWMCFDSEKTQRNSAKAIPSNSSRTTFIWSDSYWSCGTIHHHNNGKLVYICIVYNFVKYVFVSTVDTSIESVLYTMKKFIDRCWLPRKMVTDSGTFFWFEDYCNNKAVWHVIEFDQVIPSKRPKSSILSMLIIQLVDQWDRLIPEVQKQVNNSDSKITKKTTF